MSHPTVTAEPPDAERVVAPRWPGAAPAVSPLPLVGRDGTSPRSASSPAAASPRSSRWSASAGWGRAAWRPSSRSVILEAANGRVASVPLDAVSDASLVLPAIAGALGIGDEPGASVADALSDALGVAPTLLVLDTVEHVRSAAPALADLRARTPGLTIVATSRVALGVPRERIVWVEPLAVPAEAATDDAAVEALLDSPAAQLFLDRARAVRPDFEVTPANAALIAAICRRLDGLPLAIELAAAALRVLAPHQLLDQLADPLVDVGVGSSPTGSGSTPRAPPGSGACGPRWTGASGSSATRCCGSTAAWRDLRDVLAVDRRVDPRPGRAPGRRADRHRGGGGPVQLAAASLVRHVDDHGYRMLTTVRDDALERLRAAGENVPMRWAHAYEVLAMVEATEVLLPTEREIEALDRLDEAHDDIREALDWATEAGDGAFAVRMTGALAEFWRTRGHHTEGRLRLASALALAPDAPAPYRRKALGGAGLLASYQGDFGLAEAYLREALAASRQDGDEEAEAIILNWLGTNAYGRGDLDAAEAYVSESLALRRRIGDPAGIATALNALGGVYHFRGELDRAREMFVESLALKQGLGNANSLAVSLTNLGLVERDAGRPEDAAGAFEEAIAIWDRTGDRQRLAVGLHNAALLALDLHRHDEAVASLDRAYEIARELGDRTEMAYALADRARVDLERGALDEAAADIAASLPRAVGLGARIIVPIGARGGGRPRGGPGRGRGGGQAVGRLGRRAHGIGVRQHAGRRAAPRRADGGGPGAARSGGVRRRHGRTGSAMSVDAAVSVAMGVAGA